MPPPPAAVTARPVPESLLLDGLQPLWATARQQLDRFGPERRGTVARPDLGPSGELALKSLLGRRPTSRLDLADLEAALVDRQIGRDLCSALTRLGCPPSSEAAQRRTARRRAAAARTALELSVADWPEPWAAQWTAGLIGAGLLGGLDDKEATSLAQDVRRLLDRLDQMEPVSASRTELAAEWFGSS
ncbi:MAG: TIGR02679 domain-containing protein, partial [Gemmatimonadota bacterium]|nr:TIGR02679 domain-containing protein [Gemmatimonadota bacterium]